MLTKNPFNFFVCLEIFSKILGVKHNITTHRYLTKRKNKHISKKSLYNSIYSGCDPTRNSQKVLHQVNGQKNGSIST